MAFGASAGSSEVTPCPSDGPVDLDEHQSQAAGHVLHQRRLAVAGRRDEQQQPHLVGPLARRRRRRAAWPGCRRSAAGRPRPAAGCARTRSSPCGWYSSSRSLARSAATQLAAPLLVGPVGRHPLGREPPGPGQHLVQPDLQLPVGDARVGAQQPLHGRGQTAAPESYRGRSQSCTATASASSGRPASKAPSQAWASCTRSRQRDGLQVRLELLTLTGPSCRWNPSAAPARAWLVTNPVGLAGELLDQILPGDRAPRRPRPAGRCVPRKASISRAELAGQRRERRRGPEDGRGPGRATRPGWPMLHVKPRPRRTPRRAGPRPAPPAGSAAARRRPAAAAATSRIGGGVVVVDAALVALVVALLGGLPYQIGQVGRRATARVQAGEAARCSAR